MISQSALSLFITWGKYIYYFLETDEEISIYKYSIKSSLFDKSSHNK